MALLIFYLLLALVVSFLCSILEAVLLSITPSYIESQLSDGLKWPRRLLGYKKDIDQPLAAILSLNTIAHTVGAAGVGAQAALIYENIPVGIISAFLTLIILIFSELIPKTLGAVYWRQLAFITTAILRVLIVLMYPFVMLSRIITRLFTTLDSPSVDRSEVVALAEIGRKEGVFTETESRILKNLIGMRSISVKDIMTPRTVMIVADENMSLKDFLHKEKYKRYSRIPLTKGSKDEITGFIHKHDVLEYLSSSDTEKDLHSFRRDLPVVSENQNIYKLYDFLTKENVHIALVVEEFGGTAGLVTMEDLLETLLGLEIVDEFDRNEDLRQYARERWKLRARRLGLLEGEDEPDNSSPDSDAKS